MKATTIVIELEGCTVKIDVSGQEKKPEIQIFNQLEPITPPLTNLQRQFAIFRDRVKLISDKLVINDHGEHWAVGGLEQVLWYYPLTSEAQRGSGSKKPGVSIDEMVELVREYVKLESGQ